MRIPKTIKVGAKRIKIVQRKNLIDQGICQFERLRIIVKVPHPDLKNTLLHEILHLISDMYNLDLTEKQVVTLTNCLRMVFVDNPKLLSLLVE